MSQTSWPVSPSEIHPGWVGKRRVPFTYLSICTHPTVYHPSVCLHQDSWAEVFVRIPPVRRTGRATACTQNAFVQSILYSREGENSLSLSLSLFLSLSLSLSLSQLSQVSFYPPLTADVAFHQFLTHPCASSMARWSDTVHKSCPYPKWRRRRRRSRRRKRKRQVAVGCSQVCTHWNKILNNKHVGERVDLHCFSDIWINMTSQESRRRVRRKSIEDCK